MGGVGGIKLAFDVLNTCFLLRSIDLFFQLNAWEQVLNL